MTALTIFKPCAVKAMPSGRISSRTQFTTTLVSILPRQRRFPVKPRRQESYALTILPLGIPPLLDGFAQSLSFHIFHVSNLSNRYQSCRKLRPKFQCRDQEGHFIATLLRPGHVKLFQLTVMIEERQGYLQHPGNGIAPPSEQA